MRMTAQYRVRPDARRGASGVDLAQHVDAPPVPRAGGVGRMVMGEEEGTLEFLGFNAI